MQLTYKCSSPGNDAHTTTIGILHLLATFDWDAKVVLAMAAFAINYGHFGLTAQLHPTNLLAKAIAMLKQLPYLLEHTDILKPRFISINLSSLLLYIKKGCQLKGKGPALIILQILWLINYLVQFSI